MNVQDFYNAIDLEHFKKPDFTVITHWHYDHTFGLHARNIIELDKLEFEKENIEYGSFI